MCIGVSNPSQKHHSPLSCQGPLKSANCPSPPLFSQSSPPSYWILWTPPLKIGFFSKLRKYQCLSFLTPTYLLKVTKFLVKMSQFGFLVMTEKNIFVYRLFLSLNISDFSSFLCKNCNPHPGKSHPTLSQQPPSKNWSPVNSPLFQN